MPDWPSNPALSLSKEERAAQYEKLKVKNSVKYSGNYPKTMLSFYKVYPNLMVVDYKNSQDNGYYENTTITFTALDGKKLTYTLCGYDQHEKMEVLRTNLYGETLLADGSTDFIDLVVKLIYTSGNEAKITCPNGDYVTFGQYGKPETYKKFSASNNGDYVLYKNISKEFSKDKPVPAALTAIRKTFSNAVVEYEVSLVSSEFEYVDIKYSNGDAFKGKLFPVVNQGGVSNFFIGTRIVEYIYQSKECPKPYEGTMACKNGDYKVYINGEIDEAKSEALTERKKVEAELKREKELAQQKAKQEKALADKKLRISLETKWGKTHVDNLLDNKKVKVGMPTGLLLEAEGKGLITWHFRITSDHGGQKRYIIVSISILFSVVCS